MFSFKTCALIFSILLPACALAQTPADSLKKDSIALGGPYAGYRTWKEYLAHQDSLTPVYHPVQLEWLTLGLGNESALPYQGIDYAVALELTYERNLLLYRLRWLDARDYNDSNHSESLDEYDALVGFGLYQPVFLNGGIGVGFRHRYHYLSDPNQQNRPPHVTVDYLALPLQAECFIPITSNFGAGLTYYATLSHEGFDHGWLLGFSFGLLKEDGKTFLPPGHP